MSKELKIYTDLSFESMINQSINEAYAMRVESTISVSYFSFDQGLRQ